MLPKKDSPRSISVFRGALCAQYVRCGKPRCRCSRGELHGPYHYLFLREDGKLIKRYVKKSEVETVRDNCQLHRGEHQDAHGSRRSESSGGALSMIVRVARLNRYLERIFHGAPDRRAATQFPAQKRRT
jgi:hypothetical protein